MGDRLYSRRVKLTIAVPVSTPGDYKNTTADIITIGGEDVADDAVLRVQFKVSKTLEKEPNTSEITITNLSSDTRKKLNVKGVKVQLEAGYQASGLATYFIGDVRTIDHVREGTDWQTKLKLGDGERAFRWARASQSFAAGTQAADVIRYLAGQMGIAVGNVPLELARVDGFNLVFAQGYTVHGAAQKALDTLIKSRGYTWSIQDGALQVLAKNQRLEATIPFFDPTSGLIGSPEMGTPEKKGKPALLKCKVLLSPLKPGAAFRIKSERYDGLLRVKKVEHTGDTRGQEWYSQVQGTVTQ